MAYPRERGIEQENYDERLNSLVWFKDRLLVAVLAAGLKRSGCVVSSDQEFISVEEYQRLTRPHKYGAKREEVDGIVFSSKKEAARYSQLKILERCGYIKNLTLQPSFKIIVNGIRICEYRGDFSYFDFKSGQPVVEDTKGMKTPVYKLKKALFEALYGRKILET